MTVLEAEQDSENETITKSKKWYMRGFVDEIEVLNCSLLKLFIQHKPKGDQKDFLKFSLDNSTNSLYKRSSSFKQK